MEFIHRNSRDVPFGWFDLLRAALAAPQRVRRAEPVRLPAPSSFLARPAP